MAGVSLQGTDSIINGQLPLILLHSIFIIQELLPRPQGHNTLNNMIFLNLTLLTLALSLADGVWSGDRTGRPGRLREEENGHCRGNQSQRLELRDEHHQGQPQQKDSCDFVLKEISLM